MVALLRNLVSCLPLVVVPSLAAQSAVTTGIRGVGPAAFLFTVAGALLLTLVFRSAAHHAVGAITARLGAWRMRHALESRSPDVLHDFILPGAYGGLVKIDHALMTAGGILCIQTRHYHGLVFGSEDEPQWTNVDGTKRRRFLNPLIQNAGRAKALQNVVPDVPVASLVVFTGNVDFPTPPSANVIRIGQLESFIAKFVFGPSKVKDWDAVWLTVRSAALTDDASRKDLQAQIA
jgi:hypothetical protein